MPVLWQASQRPMYVRTVWVDGFRHAILSHDDPYLRRFPKRHRPHSSASCIKTDNRNSRLSLHSDEFSDCLRKFKLTVRTDRPNIARHRPITSHEVLKLNLSDVEHESDDEFLLKATPQPLNENNGNNYGNLSFNMKHLRANKTSRTDVKENTDLSDRVLQWLDLAGKVDLLAPENAERMSQPRHSWPEIQRRNHNLSKSKTAFDIRAREGGKIYSPKAGDSPKAQPSGAIDRHEFYVPTSANTIENYARQSRNVRITPRHETVGKTKEYPKTKPRELRANVLETRQKVVSERHAVEKQYADMLSKKLIPDLSKTPKKQVHIFMPDMPKKTASNATDSRTASILSSTSYK